MEDQVGDFLKQLAAKLELVLLLDFNAHTSNDAMVWKGVSGQHYSGPELNCNVRLPLQQSAAQHEHFLSTEICTNSCKSR